MDHITKRSVHVTGIDEIFTIGAMSVGRRQILGGMIATLGTFAGAAPADESHLMFGMIGKMTLAPGKRAEVAALLLDATKHMPGCLIYVVAQDNTDEDSLWITEAWESKESHDASVSLPEVKEAIAAARPMITGFSNQVVTTPLGGYGLSMLKK